MGLVTASQFNLTPDIAGSMSRGISLGEQFKQMQMQKEQSEFLKGGLNQPDALSASAKLGLDFQKQVADGLGLLDKQSQQVDQKRLNEAADFAFSASNMPIEQQNIAINKRIELLESQGRDASQTKELLTMDPEARKKALSSVQLAALPNEKRLAVMRGVQAGTGQREFESLIAGMSPEDQEKARRIKLGLDPSAGTSAAERIAQNEELTQKVAQSQGAITKEKESKKLEVQQQFKPQIAKAVKLAESEAKERGETLTALNRSKAAMPGLEVAVGELRGLASVATSTLGGKAFDAVLKETGFGSTKGATARAKFIAIVNNQVLPLLKETFGAAFTFQEGEALKATMGDPDASPEEKMAQLDAFISQKRRDIETREAQLSEGQAPQESDPLPLTPEEQAELQQLEAKYGGN